MTDETSRGGWDNLDDEIKDIFRRGIKSDDNGDLFVEIHDPLTGKGNRYYSNGKVVPSESIEVHDDDTVLWFWEGLEEYWWQTWEGQELTLLEGRPKDGKYSTASNELRSKVFVAILSLPPDKQDLLASQCARVKMPNIDDLRFTVAMGRWLLKMVIPKL